MVYRNGGGGTWLLSKQISCTGGMCVFIAALPPGYDEIQNIANVHMKNHPRTSASENEKAILTNLRARFLFVGDRCW